VAVLITLLTHHITLGRPHHCPDQGSDIQETRVDEVGQLQYEQIHYELSKNDIFSVIKLGYKPIKILRVFEALVGISGSRT